jgi:hypothetical protein
MSTAPRHVAPRDRAATGKSLRTDAPRSSHAAWYPAPNRPDPIALLEEQAAERLPELVPMCYGRMSASPFAVFRGAAYVMASDLAGTTRSGIRVQLCGDADLSNFGGFASAERQMLFDLNDFDETLPGPWEWDVKRLAASVAVAARENGCARGQREAMVRRAASEYRKAIRDFAGMRTLDVWYARASATDLEELLRPRASRSDIREFDRTVAKGRRKDSMRAPMRARAIRSRSRATSARAMCSIARSPSSPRTTPTRTSATTRHSSTRSPAAAWRLKPGSERPWRAGRRSEQVGKPGDKQVRANGCAHNRNQRPPVVRHPAVELLC